MQPSHPRSPPSLPPSTPPHPSLASLRFPPTLPLPSSPDQSQPSSSTLLYRTISTFDNEAPSTPVYHPLFLSFLFNTNFYWIDTPLFPHHSTDVSNTHKQPRRKKKPSTKNSNNNENSRYCPCPIRFLFSFLFHTKVNVMCDDNIDHLYRGTFNFRWRKRREDKRILEIHGSVVKLQSVIVYIR